MLGLCRVEFVPHGLKGTEGEESINGAGLNRLNSTTGVPLVQVLQVCCLLSLE
jgi:hypothetical protein